MSDYDFTQLSPYDLEILTRDLLQAHWDVDLESFKTGKDGGIDLRYAQAGAGLIVQVKHYARTGFGGLLREVEKEAKKLRTLKPKRYVLVTSVPLSATNKDAIVQAVGSQVLVPEDVLGREDLNNLLGQHPKIERAQFKLWLASRAVLDQVLHNAELTRSDFKVRQVHEQLKRYVISDAFHQAMAQLDKERVVIVAGPPGVGKTTLADLLLYRHLEQGYQAVVIERDIEEAQRLFQPDVKQVFYFDDFMGATFSGDKSDSRIGVQDRAILNFIALAQATPTARLILTTREHVYAQAVQSSERLREAGLESHKVFLRLDQYSLRERARILYNHMHFSDLPDEFRDQLLRDNFYLRIIRHPKFNPRLIAWLSNYRRVSVKVENYRAFVENLLQNPAAIWRHAYEQEISNAGRSILLALWSLDGKAAASSLQAAAEHLHRGRAERYGFSTRPEDFRTGLRELNGSFLQASGAHGYEVLDPSVLDLLNAVMADDPANAIDVLDYAGSFAQIERVWVFARTGAGMPVKDAMRREAGRVAPNILKRAVAERRVGSSGNFAYFGPSYETRLALVAAMAHATRAPALESLVQPVFDQLVATWGEEDVNISDAVDAYRKLEPAEEWLGAPATILRRTMRDAIFTEAATGCYSDDLRELLTLLPSGGSPPDELEAARQAFAWYRDQPFRTDLDECRSLEQFDALREDLNGFADSLGVDIGPQADLLSEARDAFEEAEDRYADHMQDEWKERHRWERDTDRSIGEMFSSLHGDRD